MRIFALILGLWLGLTATAACAEPPERRVLVMLRLPPVHARADSSYSGAYGSGAGPAARRRLAHRLARAHGLTLVDAWPMPGIGVDCFVMTAPEGRSPAAEALAREPGVAWAQPMNQFHGLAAAAPDDPLFRLQPAAVAWRLADLRQAATGRGVKVAVVDSRVDVTHPDLAGQAQISRDFTGAPPSTGERHGTGVAGVIAAVANNRLGIAGVAPGARLLALRACRESDASAGTLCDTLSLAKAIDFAVANEARVINLSLAGPPDPLLARLLDAATGRGALVVGAVDPALPGGGFPASHPGVIAVARDAAAAGVRAWVAPGRDVPTTEPGGGWGVVNGSSFSAAHISGLLALMLERSPRLRPPVDFAITADRAVDPCATLARTAPACGRGPSLASASP